MGELTDHLADLRAEEVNSGRNAADAESAALARLGNMDDLAKAMMSSANSNPGALVHHGRCSVWRLRWFLRAASAIALFILWSGWNIFLPGADTPFGGHREGGFANLYFQFGKAIYFFAPILVGWGIGALAFRQRLKAIWPAVGLMLIALIGGVSNVQAGRTAVPGGLGHIRMGFSFAPTVQGGYPYFLVRAAILLSITVLPYLIWRLQLAYKRSA